MIDDWPDCQRSVIKVSKYVSLLLVDKGDLEGSITGMAACFCIYFLKVSAFSANAFDGIERKTKRR